MQISLNKDWEERRADLRGPGPEEVAMVLPLKRPAWDYCPALRGKKGRFFPGQLLIYLQCAAQSSLVR
jgi:hypothetical protein